MIDLTISEKDFRLIKKILLQYAEENYLDDYKNGKECFDMYLELSKICY